MKIGETPTVLGQRDAFHVPAIAAMSDERIFPGDSVRFIDEALTKIVRADLDTRHGIADPFTLNRKGDLILVILAPGKTINLLHHFDVALDFVDPPIPLKTEEIEEPYIDTCRGCYG